MYISSNIFLYFSFHSENIFLFSVSFFKQYFSSVSFIFFFSVNFFFLFNATFFSSLVNNFCFQFCSIVPVTIFLPPFSFVRFSFLYISSSFFFLFLLVWHSLSLLKTFYICHLPYPYFINTRTQVTRLCFKVIYSAPLGLEKMSEKKNINLAWRWKSSPK